MSLDKRITETNSLMMRAWSILGILGIVLCSAGILGVWYTRNRVDRVVERVFDRAEESLVATTHRLQEVEQALAEARITTEELQDGLKKRGREIAEYTLDSRLQLQACLARIDGRLNKADLLLDNAAATVEQFCQLLEVGEDLGLPIRAHFAEPALDTLRLYQANLVTARGTVSSIDANLMKDDLETATGQQPAMKVAARLLATFGTFDDGIQACSKQIRQIQERISALETRSRSRIFIVACGVTVVLLWMGVGQFALWRHAAP